ncbi:hypothetical protein ACEPAG_1305 [Sanghuangporus baumii]
MDRIDLYSTYYGLDPFFGTKFKTDGIESVKRVLLFDRASDVHRGGHAEKKTMQVNSSLIAHLAKEMSSSKVDVQVVSIPDRIEPPLDSELLRCTNSAFTCFGNKQELFSQLVAGYRYLHENWKVEAMEETRDPVYLFGDEEGALVANALAHMIIRAGVLDRKWGRIFDDAFKDAFRIASFDKDEEAQVFRITRAQNLSVDLIGLWCSEEVPNTVHADGYYIKDAFSCNTQWQSNYFQLGNIIKLVKEHGRATNGGRRQWEIEVERDSDA